jgi:hypothetical protein
VSVGDWAIIIASVAWAVLVLVLAILSIRIFGILGSTREMIDGIRTETVPTLAEVRTTVILTNKEFDRLDVIMVSAGNITRSVERVTRLVDLLSTTPLIKAVSFSYGAQQAFRRFQGQR